MLTKLLTWLSNHKPIFCIRCGNIKFRKDIHYKMLTTGSVVTLCHDCEKIVFHPWSV